MGGAVRRVNLSFLFTYPPAGNWSFACCSAICLFTSALCASAATRCRSNSATAASRRRSASATSALIASALAWYSSRRAIFDLSFWRWERSIRASTEARSGLRAIRWRTGLLAIRSTVTSTQAALMRSGDPGSESDESSKSPPTVKLSRSRRTPFCFLLVLLTFECLVSWSAINSRSPRACESMLSQ